MSKSVRDTKPPHWASVYHVILSCEGQMSVEKCAKEAHVPPVPNDRSRDHGIVDHVIISERKCVVVYCLEHTAANCCAEKILWHFFNV